MPRAARLARWPATSGAARRGVVERDAHQVANRDDPDDPAALDHREVTEATVDHQGSRLVSRVRRLHGFRMPRHAVLDGRTPVAIVADGPEDIALGQDPEQPFPFEHDGRPDAARHHLCRGLAEWKPTLDRE